MNPAVEAFAIAVEQALVAALPTAAADISRIIAEVKARQTPQLAAPPPVDEQAAIDADEDRLLREKKP